MKQTTTYAPVEAYLAATVADKARLRAKAEAGIKAAIDNLDLEAAAAAKAALDAYLASGATKAAAPTDYAALVAQRVANLRHAADLIESGLVRPTGVPEEADLTRTVEGPIQADTEAATKLAEASVARSSVRSDIQAAIVEAFADLPSGSFLTSQQIANKQGLPSSGAVSARHEAWNEKQAATGIKAVPAAGDRALGYEKA